jgi:hypothetical protein
MVPGTPVERVQLNLHRGGYALMKPHALLDIYVIHVLRHGLVTTETGTLFVLGDLGYSVFYFSTNGLLFCPVLIFNLRIYLGCYMDGKCLSLETNGRPIPKLVDQPYQGVHSIRDKFL